MIIKLGKSQIIANQWQIFVTGPLATRRWIYRVLEIWIKYFVMPRWRSRYLVQQGSSIAAGKIYGKGIK